MFVVASYLTSGCDTGTHPSKTPEKQLSFLSHSSIFTGFFGIHQVLRKVVVVGSEAVILFNIRSLQRLSISLFGQV